METWFTFENLHRAYLDCRKRKSATLNHLRFSYSLEENLLALERELSDRTYRPGRSIAFVVQRPKVREIFAAEFRDRVVHHLLYNYLSPYYERTFVYDSWACRKGKGTHGALARLRGFIRDIERERERVERVERDGQAYYLKMDVKSFFTTIDKDILYGLVARKIKNEEILWLARTIIFHDCARDVPPKVQSGRALFARLPAEKSLFKVGRGKGLPIGNLTSQFFANVYMNELDQFAKHTLKARYYMRYVDDFLILSRDREELERYRGLITEFLRERLALTVHPTKQVIRPVADGIDFVGYIAKPGYVLVRRRVVGDWKRRLDKCGKAGRRRGRQTMASYLAYASWGNTRGLRLRMARDYPRFAAGRRVPWLDDAGKAEFLNSLER